MKNLENYGVQELNAKEVRETEGGGWLAYALGWIVGAMSKAGEGMQRAEFGYYPK